HRPAARPLIRATLPAWPWISTPSTIDRPPRSCGGSSVGRTPSSTPAASPGNSPTSRSRSLPTGGHSASTRLPRPPPASGFRSPGPNVPFFPQALSDRTGTAPFLHVIDLPGYSGFRERPYPRPDVRRQWIEVGTVRLDEILRDEPVKMIKIDVEGAEYLVM